MYDIVHALYNYESLFFFWGGEVHIRCVNYLMENDGKRIRSFKFPTLYGTYWRDSGRKSKISRLFLSGKKSWNEVLREKNPGWQLGNQEQPARFLF